MLPMPLHFLRTAFTFISAWAAAALCVQLHTPLPWMIGPLVATAVLSMLGAPTYSLTPLRNLGQWVIGAALGLYFTPPVVAVVLGLWWAMLLNVLWALALGAAFGAWLHRVHHGPGKFHIPGLSRTTTYFAAPIGGASEMTLMAERRGAQTELVASSHSLRVLLVTLIIPFGFQFAGLHGLDTTLPGPRDAQWPGLAALGALTGIGCWVLVKLKLTNPWFLGALAASMAVTASGQTWSAFPVWMTNAAQLVIGISLGVRFTRSFVHLAPRWLASVALGTVAMIGLCAGFAVALAKLTSLHWTTVLLGTSPGGIAEMAITAKVLQLGVPLVTAFHVTRLAAVLLLAEPIYSYFYANRTSGPVK
jgi:membrane AbrB-like protein